MMFLNSQETKETLQYMLQMHDERLEELLSQRLFSKIPIIHSKSLRSKNGLSIICRTRKLSCQENILGKIAVPNLADFRIDKKSSYDDLK